MHVHFLDGMRTLVYEERKKMFVKFLQISSTYCFRERPRRHYVFLPCIQSVIYCQLLSDFFLFFFFFFFSWGWVHLGITTSSSLSSDTVLLQKTHTRSQTSFFPLAQHQDVFHGSQLLHHLSFLFLYFILFYFIHSFFKSLLVFTHCSLKMTGHALVDALRRKQRIPMPFLLVIAVLLTSSTLIACILAENLHTLGQRLDSFFIIDFSTRSFSLSYISITS